MHIMAISNYYSLHYLKRLNNKKRGRSSGPNYILKSSSVVLILSHNLYGVTRHGTKSLFVQLYLFAFIGTVPYLTNFTEIMQSYM